MSSFVPFLATRRGGEIADRIAVTFLLLVWAVAAVYADFGLVAETAVAVARSLDLAPFA